MGFVDDERNVVAVADCRKTCGKKHGWGLSAQSVVGRTGQISILHSKGLSPFSALP